MTAIRHDPSAPTFHASADLSERDSLRTLDTKDGGMAFVHHAVAVALLSSDVARRRSCDPAVLAREGSIRWLATSVVISSGRPVPEAGGLPGGARFISRASSRATLSGHLRETRPDLRELPEHQG